MGTGNGIEFRKVLLRLPLVTTTRAKYAGSRVSMRGGIGVYHVPTDAPC